MYNSLIFILGYLELQLMNKKVTFKEVCGVEDLERCFKFRLQKYKACHRQAFLNGDNLEIDIDGFDVYSKHWGVYDQKGEIISYARIVQKDKNLSIASQIEELLEKHSIPDFAPQKTSFPITIYQTTESKQAITSLFANNAGKRVFELSRFVTQCGSPLSISKFIVNAGLGVYKYCYQSEMIILSCTEKHEKFWRHYGFKNMEEDLVYKKDHVKSVNLYSQLTGIHPKLNCKLEEYAQQYQSKQEISIEI